MLAPLFLINGLVPKKSSNKQHILYVRFSTILGYYLCRFLSIDERKYHKLDVKSSCLSTTLQFTDMKEQQVGKYQSLYVSFTLENLQFKIKQVTRYIVDTYGSTFYLFKCFGFSTKTYIYIYIYIIHYMLAFVLFCNVTSVDPYSSMNDKQQTSYVSSYCFSTTL